MPAEKIVAELENKMLTSILIITHQTWIQDVRCSTTFRCHDVITVVLFSLKTPPKIVFCQTVIVVYVHAVLFNHEYPSISPDHKICIHYCPLGVLSAKGAGGRGFAPGRGTIVGL
jgi:hypothetical protein